MKVDYVKVANELKEMGYVVIPVDDKKRSTIKLWHAIKDNSFHFADQDCFGIAILTGRISDHFGVIDIDRKDVLEKIPKELLKNFVVQETPRGHHILFKAQLSETDNYQEYFAKDKSVSVRQGRSYYIVSPTPGYNFMDGLSMKHVRHVSFNEWAKLTTYIKVNCIQPKSFDEVLKNDFVFSVLNPKEKDMVRRIAINVWNAAVEDCNNYIEEVSKDPNGLGAVGYDQEKVASFIGIFKRILLEKKLI